MVHEVLGHSSIYKRVATAEFEIDDHAVHSEHAHVTKQNLDRGFARLNAAWWRRVWCESLHDLKHLPWKLMGYRLYSHVLPISIIAADGIVLRWMSSVVLENDDICTPDGTFSFRSDTHNRWQANSTFSITLPVSGGYDLGTAKLIDVLWDVGVGRGGQALLAMLGYQTFTRALTRSMEQAPASHDTFKAITLHPNTITGVGMMAQGFFVSRGTRAKLTIFWIILSALFILVAPTWLSAMTGYAADLQPYVVDSAGSLVPVSDFHRVFYTVHDGERLGMADDNHVISLYGQDSTTVPLSDEADYLMSSCSTYDQTSIVPIMTLPACAWIWHISDYISQFGFRPRVANSTFVHPNGTEIYLAAEGKTLNISAYFYGESVASQDDRCGGDYDFVNDTTFGSDGTPYGYCVLGDVDTGNYIFKTLNPPFWYNASNTLYDLTELIAQGTCQQLSDVKYKWGFSFLLLYTFLVVFLIWAIAMFVIYNDAYLNSTLDANRRHLGTERAVLDLAAAMEKKLSDRNTALDSDEQIRQLVQQGRVSYQDLLLDTLLPSRWTRIKQWWRISEFRPWVHAERWWRVFEIRPWAQAEKWWLVALSVFTVFLIVSCTHVTDVSNYYDDNVHWAIYIAPFPVLSILLVLYLGRGVRSRWIVFALCSVVCAISIIIVPLVLSRP